MPFTPLNQPAADINGTSTSTMAPDSVDDMDPQVEQEEGQDVDKRPVTPRKRGRGKRRENPGSGEEDKTSPKKSKSPKKSGPSGLGPTPMTYKEATEIDKLIIRMKEVDLKGWSEIQKVVEEATGAKMGGTSTIRMRYTRMKSNFVVFEKYDEPRLLQTKKEIEDRFETEKWQKIADGIEAKGGIKYPASAVQKKFKELSSA